MSIMMRSEYYVMRNRVSRPNVRYRLLIRGEASEARKRLIRNAVRLRNASPPPTPRKQVEASRCKALARRCRTGITRRESRFSCRGWCLCVETKRSAGSLVEIVCGTVAVDGWDSSTGAPAKTCNQNGTRRSQAGSRDLAAADQGHAFRLPGTSSPADSHASPPLSPPTIPRYRGIWFGDAPGDLRWR